MNIQLNSSNNPFMANNRFLSNNGLKSTQDKLQRQAERDNQIHFLENQKNNLSNMKCDSLEEIGRKLDLFHSYEDQIAEVRKAYNYEQMFHATDEAREAGERIAKAVEKYAPKTDEERKEEMVEEALGIDEIKSKLTESMEELSRMAEEISKEAAEMTEEAAEMTGESAKMTEEVAEMTGESAEMTDEAPEMSVETAEMTDEALEMPVEAAEVTDKAAEMTGESVEMPVEAEGLTGAVSEDALMQEQPVGYRRIDLLI